MAELLDRLLARTRKRNPFSDVMGPDPLESAATMDAAQGSDVSMPAPVSRRAPAADAGSNILMASGGGGSPFRTAGGSGASAAPMQETGGPIRNFFSGGQPQMRTGMPSQQGGCANGQCGPRASVGSNYQIMDDGGFPVTTTVVGSAPMASGGIQASVAPTPPIGDLQGGMDAARFWENAGDPSARELEKQGLFIGLAADQQALNKTIAEGNLELQRRAADFADREQKTAAQKTAAEITALNQDTLLSAQLTQVSKESTGKGQFETRRSIIATMIEEGGSPEDAAHALARLSSPVGLKLDKDGKPVAPESASAIPQTALDDARRQAFGAFGVHLLVTGQQTRETADLVSSGGTADSVAPKPNESQDEYVARVYQAMAERRGQTAARAADAIIGGLQRSQAWADGNWNEVNLALESDVGSVLNQYVKKTFLEARQDDMQALPPEQRKAAEFETINRAEQYANYTLGYFRAEALGAFLRSKGGQYDPNMTYIQNAGRAAEYFGGDKKPDSPKPVDSNDTLPPPGNARMPQ